MKNDHEKLERLIGNVLREQPLLPAPLTLEARVFAALESGAAVSRWRKGFVHWPVLARVAFILASIGFVRFALLAVDWTVAAADPSSWFSRILAKVGWVKVLALGLFSAVRSIPEFWLWGGFAIIAALYAAFFAIGAVAYRALYTDR